MPRAFAQALLICICALPSYHRTVAAEVTDEPAPACPVPKLQQTEWRSVDLVDIGVRLKMPKKYTEKHWAVTVGDPVPLATFRAGHLEEFTIKLDAPADPPLADHKVGFPSLSCTTKSGFTFFTSSATRPSCGVPAGSISFL
jgi:hypothetical protein